MRLKTPVDQSKFSRHSNSRPKSSGVQNVLKISDTPVDSRLDVIPEHEVANARIEENGNADFIFLLPNHLLIFNF